MLSDTSRWISYGQRMTWTPYIKLLKATKYSSIHLASKIWLQSQNSLVRPKLDYGSPIFSLAPQSTLQLLDLIHSASLRLVTGASHTSPVISLSAEAAEPPLNFRRLRLTAGFLFSSAQFTQLPIFDHLFNSQEISKFHNQEKRNIRLFFEELSAMTSTHPRITQRKPLPFWTSLHLRRIPRSHSLLRRWLAHKSQNRMRVFGCRIYLLLPALQLSSILTAGLVAILSCIQSLCHNPLFSTF